MIVYKDVASSIGAVLDIIEKVFRITELALNHKTTSLLMGGRVNDSKHTTIAGNLNLQVAKLSIKYLGLPLVTGSLGSKECLPLLEKVTARIINWKNGLLSHDGERMYSQC